MLQPEYSNSFKRDYKKIKKQNKDICLMKEIMEDLVNGKPLPPKNRDHALAGNYAGYRSCHIQPDWVLIYKIMGNMIVFSRTGSHSKVY